MTTVLTRVAVGVAKDPDAARGLMAGPDAARDLFELVDRRLSEVGAAARRGRADDLQHRRRRARVGRTPLGHSGARSAGGTGGVLRDASLRWVCGWCTSCRSCRPINTASARSRPSTCCLRRPKTATIPASDYMLETPLGPASLRMRWEGAGDEPRPNAFLLHAPSGEPLVEVSMSPADLDAARNAWRRRVVAVVLAIAGITVLLLIGPVLDRRAAAPRRPVPQVDRGRARSARRRVGDVRASPWPSSSDGGRRRAPCCCWEG